MGNIGCLIDHAVSYHPGEIIVHMITDARALFFDMGDTDQNNYFEAPTILTTAC